MREILFRGKCTDTGRWYEGQYIHLHKTTYCVKEDYDRYPDNDIHQIVFEHMTDWGLPNQYFRADVIPETVGQYTGLTDKNGKKIFEGDVVRYTERRLGGEDVSVANIVEFIEGAFAVHHYFLNHWLRDVAGGSARLSNIEVIGNIHDHPELLEGTDGI